jgi:heme-degrading monooxygenase HmoA
VWSVVARLWHGWTDPANADAYAALLEAEILPGIHRIDGYLGAYLLRREDGERDEFATVTLWRDYEAVRAFAGEDWEAAVVPPDAQSLLADFDARSIHYDVVAEPAAR